MTDEANEKGTDNPKDGAGKGEELIAGKFKTQEDLVEAYKSAERMAHERAEETARWKGTVDQLLAGGEGAAGTEDTPEAREKQQSLDEQYTERFIQNPKAGLREFGEELITHVYDGVSKMIDTRDGIRDFVIANPDVRQNPELFALELQKTKGTLADRLSKAKDSYNDKLAAMLQQHDEDKKKAKEFEKDNKKGAADIGTGGNEPAPTKEDEEKDESFDEYLKERKDRGSKMFGLNP